MKAQDALARSQVLDICYAARTLPAVEAAFDVRGRWLSEHPDDEEVFDLGEMLAMMQEGLELAASEARVDVAATGAAL